MKWTQSNITRDVHIIDSTSSDGRRMAQKRTCGSQLRCSMFKRPCNITSMTTCRSNFPVCSAVEAVQDLCKVPEQVKYKRHICVAGMSVEKL